MCIRDRLGLGLELGPLGLGLGLGLGLMLVVLVTALNELRVSSVGVEILLSVGILWNSGGRNSDLYLKFC